MLHVHRSERADGLVKALAELLADPLEDPMAAEVVAVPTRGMERWLTQRLSGSLGATAGRSDGVCANVAFPWPRRVVGDAVAAAAGVDPERDPWLPERATWPLLDVLEASLGESWLDAVAAHLGADSDQPDPVRRARRLSVVRHAADLFDRYALNRPEMIRAWATGDDTDGAGGSLPPMSLWQAELWRRLRLRIGIPGPAERLDPACARLRDDASVVDLPGRLSLFGLTRLPAGHLHVLQAIAAARDVHLLLLHPSPALWDAIAQTDRSGPRSVRRADDSTTELPSNRLLASWGRDAREMQLVLGSEADRVDHHHPVESGDGTLLQRIQADVRADREPPGPPLPGAQDDRVELDPKDRSIQIHACHGRARQVEVMRDAILHLLATDPTLEPRDVIVMCPDIETFAPLIHATFGSSEPPDDDTRKVNLRVRLADRSLRQTNPVLVVHRAAARPRRPAADRVAGAQPDRSRARAPALPVRRRRPRPHPELDRPGGDPVGTRRRPPGALPARRAHDRHLERRSGPSAARRDDDRGRAAAVRGRAAGRRRRQRLDRSRRPCRRARRATA